jgi:hypothetical protein
MIRALKVAFALSCAVPVGLTAANANPTDDRLSLIELMNRYGVVHDFGSPDEYADLFTSDGEIAVAKGGPAVVKGRQALMAQAKRDHEKYVAPIGPKGENLFFMRHIISNQMVSLEGETAASGSSFVITMVQDVDKGPSILSFGRYFDKYVKQNGRWLIARREIVLDFGDQELAKKLGFRP